jgi:hypothetical protein
VALTEECRVLVTEMREVKQPEDYLLTRENGSLYAISAAHGKRSQRLPACPDYCSTIFAARRCGIWFDVAFPNLLQ